MGRKKMKTSERFDIRMRVEGALHKRIAKAAEKKSLPVAAYIRTAVIEQLKRDDREDKT